MLLHLFKRLGWLFLLVIVVFLMLLIGLTYEIGALEDLFSMDTLDSLYTGVILGKNPFKGI